MAEGHHYFPLKIFVPLGVFLSDDVEQVIFSSKDGEVTVMPHHAPYIFHLRPGFVTIVKNNVPLNDKIFICEGMAMVDEKGQLSIFAQDAILSSEMKPQYFKDRIDFYRQKSDDIMTDHEKIDLNDKIFALTHMEELFLKV